MSPDEITAQWLSSVLGGEIDSVEARPIGDGHVGTSLRLRLSSADPSVPATVVAKLPAQDERSLLLAATVRSYEREVKFYRELAHTVDIRVPYCHHADWEAATNDFVLILEDMAPARQGDQIAGCTRDDASLAVRALAGLHGPHWDDAALADVDWLGGNDPEASADGYALMWAMFFPGFASTYERYLTPEMMEVAERFGHEIVRFVDGRDRPFSLVHTDYRLDNMLFATDAGGPALTVVDWQSPTHGTPITDLSYFCGAGLVPDDRRAYERDLVADYANALRRYDIDVDDAWLWEQYRREAFHGLVITVLTSQMVTMNDRSLDMFGAMASRHLQHALDLDSLSAI
jgi:hypothetical protein